MNSRALIAGAVAAGCIAAAGVGGYLAVSTATQSSEAAPAPGATAPPAMAVPAPAPVAEPASKPMAQPEPPEAMPAQPPAPAPRHPGRRVPAPARPAPEPAPVLVAERTELPGTVTSLPPAAPAPASTPDAVPAGPPSANADAGWDEIELPANAVIGIRLDTTVSSETARVEDRVEARVTRAVAVDGRPVIPAGARLDGVVTMVEQGGKIRERARIGIRFTSIRIDDAMRVPLQTETIFRAGEAPGGEATAKIGASAVVGSILGGVFGGKKGAAIGGAAGAAGGTALVVSGDRNPATLESGTPLTVRLAEPALFRIAR